MSSVYPYLYYIISGCITLTFLCGVALGSGCCHALYENTQSAVKAMGISVEVEYITDLKKVMEYGVMSVPALVVNNKVVSTGKVLKTENVQKLLQKIVSEK